MISSVSRFNSLLANSSRVNSSLIERSYDRLSSGSRINRGSDDPAGLAVSLQLSNQIRGKGVQERALQDEISVLQIASATVTSVQDITLRQQELAMQAANGTLSDVQRQALNEEYTALSAERDRISQTARFAGREILGGDFTLKTPGETDQASLTLPKLTNEALGVPDNILTQEASTAALDGFNQVNETINQISSSIGAFQQIVGSQVERLGATRLAEQEALGRITDIDVAEETATLTGASIQAQAGVALSAQANQLALDAGQALL